MSAARPRPLRSDHDPFGHCWGLAQQLRNVPREEIADAAAAMFG
jgi:hypothetical protein